jgi:dienelactone hydrolase
MKTDSIEYCRRHAAAAPLFDTDNVLTTQFEELDQTLSALLQKAAKQRRAEVLDLARMRNNIEAMLGHWHYADKPKVTETPITQTASHQISTLKWEVLDGVNADGIFIRPRVPSLRSAILYIPDCSQTPAEVYSEDGPIWRLVSEGFAVLVLNLISRGQSAGRPLNNRRHLHRLGWQIGQTLLGAEVAKARSALRVLGTHAAIVSDRIGIFGYDQGGQIALLTAALEGNIQATVVSNYFGSSERAEWQPIDRVLFGQARSFDDGVLATLCAPGSLCIEADPHQAWPQDAETADEIARSTPGFTRQIDFTAAKGLALSSGQTLVESTTPCGVDIIQFFRERLGQTARELRPASIPLDIPTTEVCRFAELEEYFYRELKEIEQERPKRSAPQSKIRDEYSRIVGRFPQRDAEFSTRWKLFTETPKLLVYELTISVYKGLHTYGVLLVPKDIPAGERRTAVICQHGFHGQPLFAAGFHEAEAATVYKQFGARLAERGYVVFCPYLCVPSSEERTRLVKKARLLGGSPIGLESQKFARGVDFLQSLPFVDGKRIGYYGLSYGGYAALWFASAEPRLAAVICSGHFNDWHRKTTDLSFQNSCYLYTPDEDMYDFGVLRTLGHAELATLQAPRPFAVEAGHQDTVFRMSWVRSEFKRVRETYRRLGVAENAQLFEFDGPHEICGQGTFPFLDRWLKHHPHS